MKMSVWGAVLVLCAHGLSAQDKESLKLMALHPANVAEYFITCPYVDYRAGMDEGHWLALDPEQQTESPADQYLSKQLLLQGESLDMRHPVTNLVVDQKNGYLHLTLDDDDLTLVYYERTDKSRFVGVRVENSSGQFPEVHWAFFNVEGWEPIPTDTLFPADWTTLFVHGTGSLDRDGLALTDFDLDLPRYGTTAHVIPSAYSSDLDGPKVSVPVPGTKRKVTLGAYQDWYRKNFVDAQGRTRTLELKWNKAQGRFDAGAVAAWSAPALTAEAPRAVHDVLHHPRNIWESFLANPELVYDGNDGLFWDPNAALVDEELRDASQDHDAPYEQKQDLVAFDALGDFTPNEATVVDVPGRYLAFDLAKWGRDPSGGEDPFEVATLKLTLVGFETTAKKALIAYRFWGRNEAEDEESSKTEFNRVAANFFAYASSGEPYSLNEEDVLPLDQVDALVLPGGSKKDQELQKAIVWDVQLPRTGGTIRLIPWQLALHSGGEKGTLETLFGTEAALQEAFAAFVKRWYGNQTLALDWNPKTGRFGSLRREARP